MATHSASLKALPRGGTGLLTDDGVPACIWDLSTAPDLATNLRACGGVGGVTRQAEGLYFLGEEQSYHFNAHARRARRIQSHKSYSSPPEGRMIPLGCMITLNIRHLSRRPAGSRSVQSHNSRRWSRAGNAVAAAVGGGGGRGEGSQFKKCCRVE
jgi:hypothetical protein